MQGCDPLDATTVEPMASVCPPSNKLSVPPNNKLAGDGSDQFEYQRSLQWNPSQYFPESSVLLFWRLLAGGVANGFYYVQLSQSGKHSCIHHSRTYWWRTAEVNFNMYQRDQWSQCIQRNNFRTIKSSQLYDEPDYISVPMWAHSLAIPPLLN
jgi:hypothetical protein